MFRKLHCSTLNYLGAQRGIQLNKGSLALICVECCKLTKHQIEAGRVAIGRILKKKRSIQFERKTASNKIHVHSLI